MRDISRVTHFAPIRIGQAVYVQKCTDWPSAGLVLLLRAGPVAAGSGGRQVCQNLEIARLDCS